MSRPEGLKARCSCVLVLVGRPKLKHPVWHSLEASNHAVSKGDSHSCRERHGTPEQTHYNDPVPIIVVTYSTLQLTQSTQLSKYNRDTQDISIVLALHIKSAMNSNQTLPIARNAVVQTLQPTGHAIQSFIPQDVLGIHLYVHMFVCSI